MRPLRTLLDRHTFRLSDSDLEIFFRPIATAAGMPQPLTKVIVDGYEVDFFWPDLGLVVETDGLRYHRTASEQAARPPSRPGACRRRPDDPALHPLAGQARTRVRAQDPPPNRPPPPQRLKRDATRLGLCYVLPHVESHLRRRRRLRGELEHVGVLRGRRGPRAHLHRRRGRPRSPGRGSSPASRPSTRRRGAMPRPPASRGRRGPSPRSAWSHGRGRRRRSGVGPGSSPAPAPSSSQCEAPTVMLWTSRSP